MDKARKQSKPTPMRDIPIGTVVFTLTKMDDENTHEIRETYYTKISEEKILHHGCIQSDPEFLEEAGRPRYKSVWSLKTGYEYPMIAALPVFPISESRLLGHCDLADNALAE